jgi:uncharacterized protein (TIGR02466 family)
MEKIGLFSIPVFKFRIEPTQEQYTLLDNKLQELFDKTADNNWGLETGRSTGELGVDLHHLPELGWLTEQARLCACRVWTELDYAHNAHVELVSAWSNVHKPGQTTGEHSHCGGSDKVDLASAYYFKKPDASGDIEFRDPLELIHSLAPTHEYTDIFGEAKHHTNVPAEQFDLVIFPAWLKHRTQVNQSTGDRVAISMNFVGNWVYE